MKTKNKKIAKGSLQDLVNLDPKYMSKMNQRDYLELERKLRSMLLRRLRGIEKGLDGNFIAPALEKYTDGEIPELSPRDASRQHLQHTVSIYQELLKAESTTLRGLKRILKAEEERIFENGKHFENTEQRKRFWSAYMEFKTGDSTKAEWVRLGSTRIQQFLGSMSFWRESEFTANDINRILEMAKSTK